MIFLVCTIIMFFAIERRKHLATKTFLSQEENGEYMIHHSKSSSDKSTEFGICLSSFTDLSRLHRFPFHALRWKGPFSIAIIVKNFNEAMIVTAFVTAIRKKEEFRNILLHLIYSKHQNVVSEVESSSQVFYQLIKSSYHDQALLIPSHCERRCSVYH